MALSKIIASRHNRRTTLIPFPGTVDDGSTLSLDFTTGVLDPRLTFTRTTNATFINSQGLVQYADANMVTGSELCDPTLYGWGQQLNPGYLFDTSVNDPFGNPGVPRISSNASSGSSAINSSSFAVSAGLTYTLTFWVRAGTSTTFLVGIYDASVPPTGAFVPASGTILSGPGSISGTGAIALTSLTSAWTKVRIYLTPANTAASRAISFYPQAAAPGGQSNYLWGVQLNIGQTPNPSYFKTVATAYQAPRFDYDPTTLQPRGLLIEASASNTCTYSGDMTQSGAGHWSVRTALITVGWTGFTAPDNTASAVKIIPDTTSSRHTLESSSTSIVSGTVYTASVFVKASGYTVASLVIAGGQTRRNFTLSGAGTVESQFGLTNTATITPVGTDGWYRITMTWTANATGGAGLWIGVPQNATTDVVSAWSGNGTSAIIAWGAQLETGSGASVKAMIWPA